MSPADALRRGTTTAMEWLGEDLLQRQHRSLLSSPIHDDPEVLQSPAAVVLGGVRVRCPPQVAGRQVRPGNVVRAEQSGASDALYSGAMAAAWPPKRALSGRSGRRPMDAGQAEEVCSEQRIPMRTMSSYAPRTHACWRCRPSITKPAFSYARIAAMFDAIA
jgi:hypothetical protein